MPSLALFHPQAPAIEHKPTNSKPQAPVIEHKPTTSDPNKDFNTRLLENHAFSSLQTCTTLQQMKQIHGHIFRNQIHQNNFVITKLVSFCFNSQNPTYATRVFNQVLNPNPFLWDAMIKGFVEFDRHEDALIFFNKMYTSGHKPTNFTFPLVLKACSKLLASYQGRIIHGIVLKLGFKLDVYVQTALLNLYVSCGEMQSARQLFERMFERDVVSWNVIVGGYARLGFMNLALQLFNEMPIRNVSSWTVLIGGFVQIGSCMEALMFFHRMLNAGVKPDKLMIVTVLSAIARLGMLRMGRWVHGYVDKNGIVIDTFVGTALIDMYLKCGSIRDASVVFDGIKSRNISCYNAMILGFGVHGLGKEAIEVFKDAEKTGIGVDDVTMIAVLSACSHSGLVDEGVWYFRSMSERYGIEPKMEHYGCMVDLLGRVGRFDSAMELVESIEADSFVLGTLAFACRLHGNIELGEELMRRISELDPDNSGMLVLKSNIYAAIGRWDDAANVRKMMKDRRIHKRSGSSWIEVDNVVHEFVCRDVSHPCSQDIYAKLAQLDEEMRLGSTQSKSI